VFEIVYGVSANSRSFWDNRNAERLGYVPQDSADSYAHRFDGPDADDASSLFQGGPYVLDGLSTDLTRLARPNDTQR
jgi:uronate dehydrogenase